MLERHFTAERINEIVNHPTIWPFVKGYCTQPLDLTELIKHQNYIGLVGEHGCVFFVKHQPGIYEFHTSVLPEGRGAWMVQGARYAFNWMFTKTDAFELLTKCPHGNIPAKAGAKAVGCSLRFTTRPIWPFFDKMVPIDVFSIIIQEWAKNADNLVETGKWFHNNLEMQYNKRGKPVAIHDEDETHDRYVGAAIEMIREGQANKAISFYNRWACMSGYKNISIVSTEPLIIDIDEARLKINKDNFEVI